MRRRKMCISGYRNECFHNEALEMTKPTLYTNFMDPVTPLWRLPTQAVAINVTYPRPRFRAPIAQENINSCLSCRPNMICVVCNHGFFTCGEHKSLIMQFSYNTVLDGESPITCAEILFNSLDSPDGQYPLSHPDGRIWYYCSEMASYQPREYISLLNPDNNYAMDYNASAKTLYNKISIDLKVSPLNEYLWKTDNHVISLCLIKSL